MERITKAFSSYLESSKRPRLSEATLRRYEQTAESYLGFLKEEYRRLWVAKLKNPEARQAFIESLADSDENNLPEEDIGPSEVQKQSKLQKEKENHIEEFQNFLVNVPIQLVLAYIDEFQRQPEVRLLGIAIFVIITITGLVQFTQYVQTAFFPTPIPTPTVSPTQSFTPIPTTAPTSTIRPTFTARPPFVPTIQQVVRGYDTAGYSKQIPLVRGSDGQLTLFVRNNTTGELAYITSTDHGQTWTAPVVFDTIKPQPHVAATIDRSDGIHLVWGVVPNPGDLNYGLLQNQKWIRRETIASGVFARDIAVDSANRPHVTWTTTDLQYRRFDGTKWLEPEKIGEGLWHPDIQLDSNDDVYIFGNGAQFFPTPDVPVGVFDNSQRVWKLTILSESPFWSGGAAAVIDSNNTIYVFWFGASSNEGGNNLVYFSRFIDTEWQPPILLDYVYTTTGTTGQESPTVGVDRNDIVYVVWRGFNDRSRPVLYARCFLPESGWLPRVTFDDRAAVDIGWPSIADTRPEYRINGVDIVWHANHGTTSVIDFLHFDCLQ